MKKVRVLIVDDSALARRLLTEILASDRDIEVVGAANDPFMVRDKIKQLHPDVITLDVEMPGMDGITFLENLMRLRPMPVVMVSTLTQAGADVTLRALELGAVDFISKPRLDLAGTIGHYANEITGKVKMAAVAQPVACSRSSLTAQPTIERSVAADIPTRGQHAPMLRTTEKIIAIGASTGGTEALRTLLSMLPPDAPAIVVSQHIPAAFSGPFAQRLDKASAMAVAEAQDGQYLLPGHVYVAPGDQHLIVERDGTRYRCRLHEGPLVNRHRPSVDVMFRSVAQAVGPDSVGIILTGMGDDGARGLKEMFDAGARTIAQDEQSSVVWGMPGSAVKLGAAEYVEALARIPAKLLDLSAQASGPGLSMSMHSAASV